MMKKRGFTLIELSIVMMIAGLLLAAYLQFYTAQLQKMRYETTRTRLEQIRTALTIYAATHLRLPCPSTPKPGAALKVKRRNAASSLAKVDLSKETEGICGLDAELPDGVIEASGDGDKGDALRKTWIGIVPVRALRLNGDQAMDGWGNLFTFAVSRRLTLPDGMHGNPLPPGVITIVNERGASAIDVPDTGRYVVVSHGPSGNGAWTPSGGQKPCEKKTLDAENCDADGVFITAPFSRAAGSTHFDDFVIHDDPDSGGTMLDKLLVCNAKKKFYMPGEPDADVDGCNGPKNVWEGACIQGQTLGPDGTHFVLHPPIALRPPAGAINNKCDCNPGYRVVEVGGWDDSTRTPSGVYDPWTGSEAGTADPAIAQIMQQPNGKESSRQKIDWYTRTLLYTCMAQ